MRTMYDAVNADNILAADRTPEMVAGYIDKIKLEPWSGGDWALFPDAVKVQIVKKASTNAGHVLDVEPGDATPAEAPGWVRMRRSAGADPSIYVQKSTWATVQAEFVRQHVDQPHYWIAHYNGDPTLPTLNGITAVAKQYRGDVAPGYDVSSVADHWPGVDDARPPQREEDDDMGFGRPCPAGTNQHADIAVAGCTALRLHCSFNQFVNVRAVLFYADTPKGSAEAAGVGGGYDGEFRTPRQTWRWDQNRPGPLEIPEHATSCTVLYDAQHEFFLSAAKS
jgi:hypothetical protein